jgi:hypothetical protein
MPYNTKALKTDVSGVKPAPQHFDPGIDDYDVALGRNGASRVELYGPDGNPLSTTEGKLAVRATEIETLLSTLVGKDFATQATLEAILDKIIATPSTEAKQEAIRLLLDSLDKKDYSTLAKQNEILTKLAALEAKLNGTLDTQLSGSNIEIGGVSFAVSGGDTLRGKFADKPDAVAAHAVIPYCFYFSIDTGVVEATDGTNWVVI